MAVFIWLSYRIVQNWPRFPLNWHNHQGRRGFSSAPRSSQYNSTSLPGLSSDCVSDRLNFFVSCPVTLTNLFINYFHFQSTFSCSTKQCPFGQCLSVSPDENAPQHGQFHCQPSATPEAHIATLARFGPALDSGQLPLSHPGLNVCYHLITLHNGQGINQMGWGARGLALGMAWMQQKEILKCHIIMTFH